MIGRVLIVDDDLAMCELVEAQLRKRGFQAAFCNSAVDALSAIDSEDFDAVVTDLNMPGMNGIELSERLAENRPDLPVIVITSFGSMETAVAALRVGAYDFINKPFEVEVLAHTLKRAIQHRHLREEVKTLRRAMDEAGEIEDLHGSSPSMKKVFSLLRRAAESDVTALINGESGTGKELVARALHRIGNRRDGPFVAINCAAMPEQLLESELFGHTQGAFTDARASRVGLFVQANGGTLFLDEIGDMPLGLQVKILRALEERCVRPVGSNNEVRFDARIVSATNRDLTTAVEERYFREDLYYRLNVIQIRLPPLRDRGRDILTLAQCFLEQFSTQMGRPVTGFTSKVAQKLLDYSWPGNVRELKNCIEHAVALTTRDQLTVEDLPERIRKHKSTYVLVASERSDDLVSMEEVERRYIQRVLSSVNGNKTIAARILGFDRKTLYRKLERYNLEEICDPGGSRPGQ
ncbi:MAG: sigma-54 dependent transcriptional regulator [Myxococcota bacterium]|nr:sigma-54 dependent transcriptional regulator [Myxococcota bacterium]